MKNQTLLVLGACCAIASAAHAFGDKKQTVEIGDPLYQMNAASLEIPAHWRFAGTVARPRGCTATGASLKYTAQSPDGAESVEALPGFAWSWSADPMFVGTLKRQGCAVSTLLSAREFLQQVAIPRLRPGAQLVGFEPLPKAQEQRLAARLAMMNQSTAQMAAQYRQAAPKNILEGAVARIRTTRDGAVIGELVTTVVSCTVSSMLGGRYPMHPIERHQCSASYVGIERAPDGKLESLRPALGAVTASLKIDPVWSDRLAEDQRKQAEQSLAASRAMGEATLKAGADAQRARDANHAAWMKQQQSQVDSAMANDRATQAATDRAAKQTILDVQGRGTYVDPNTGKRTETTSQYGHVWQAGDGTTLHTNDPTYDPNGRDNQTWTELQPTAPR